jgi:anti-sigma B factor antagonist
MQQLGTSEVPARKEAPRYGCSTVRPQDHVTVTVRSSQGVTVLEVSGEIDMATGEALTVPLSTHLDAAPSGLVLDLTKVEFIGSTGLAVLAETHQRTRDGMTKLGIVANTPIVLRPLEIAGFLEFLPIYPTLAAALHEVAGHRARH